MISSAPTFCIPELSARPFSLTVERAMDGTPASLHSAWTEQLDEWFAAPGSALMRAEVNAPFFLETVHKPENQEAKRQPHPIEAHHQAWPYVVEQLDNRMKEPA